VLLLGLDRDHGTSPPAAGSASALDAQLSWIGTQAHGS
jgi:hypothetical protein